jgi:4-amino-4-deoxy-L-arabinose transferase-like glycosyltransferase
MLKRFVQPQYLIAIVTVAVAVCFLSLVEKSPSIADTIGYTYAGEQLAGGKGLAFVDDHNATLGPYFSMFAYQIRREPGRALYFGFPPGLPLLLAFGAVVSRIHYIVPLLAAAGVLTTYFLGGLSSDNRWAALWAALILAWTPDYWTFGTAAWSEIPSAAFVALGMAFYLLSRHEGIRPHRQVLAGLVGALLLSYSFFIRYANAVTILPALALYEVVSNGVTTVKRRWLFFLILVASMFGVLVFNHVYYGGAFLTNYSPEHGWYPEPAFSLGYAFGPSFVNGFSFRAIMVALWQNFGLFLVIVPLGWSLLPRRRGVIHAVAALATIGLYSVYAFAAMGINSRFVLPAFPFLAVGVGMGLVAIGRYLPSSRARWAAGTLVLAVLSSGLLGRISSLQLRNAASENLVVHVQQITAPTEADAVFLSYVFNDLIIYYTGKSVLNYRRIPPSDPAEGRYHWELLGPCMNEMVAALLANGTPVYYVEDQSPSFANSLEKLQARFELETVGSAPTVYRLHESPMLRDKQDDFECPLLNYN